jgi:site-specific recombinase XerD
MKDDLCKVIKERRPNVSENTIKTYCSTLSSLYRKLDGDNGIKFFESNKKDILKHIDGLTSNQSKKTTLSALYIITEDKDYHAKMLHYANEVNNEYKQQKTDPDRLKNLPTLDQLKEKYNIYKSNLKKNPTIENWIDYLIVALTSTALMPPRRNEWAMMKVSNINKVTDNYLTNKEFVFNKFKTAKYKTEEEKKMEIPDELNKMIKKFKKVSDNEYLIYNPSNGKPFSSSAFTKKLNKIYGENVGIDSIRSVYLTDLYKGIPKLKELEQIHDEMGNTISSGLMYYVKHD